jgi:hypothetical protein
MILNRWVFSACHARRKTILSFSILRLLLLCDADERRRTLASLTCASLSVKRHQRRQHETARGTHEHLLVQQYPRRHGQLQHFNEELRQPKCGKQGGHKRPQDDAKRTRESLIVVLLRRRRIKHGIGTWIDVYELDKHSEHHQQSRKNGYL